MSRTIDQQWRLAPHSSCHEARIARVDWAPERIAPVHLPLLAIGVVLVIAGVVGKFIF